MGEDFNSFGLEQHNIPTVMIWLGAMDRRQVRKRPRGGETLPGPHTSRFEPQPEPTLRTGVIAMTSAATALLQPWIALYGLFMVL